MEAKVITTARFRTATIALLMTVITSTFVAVGSPAAMAADGLTFRSDATYTVHPEDGFVAVNNHITLTNVKPSKRSGNRITQYYYDSITIGVPDEAEEIVATSGGRTLTLNIENEDGFRFVEIRFPSRLFYKKTRTIDFDFKMHGDDPRSFSLMRVNPAYVSFFAWAWGDSGKSSLKVVAPEGFQLEFDGENRLPSTTTDEEGMRAWAATEIEEPHEWAMLISGPRDEALLETEFTVGDAEIQVLSWPGDEEWLGDVRSTLEDALPALVDAVGLSWPVEGDLIIRESVAPNRFGYAGWYFTEDDEIEMGEELDPIVVLHEASHAWFHEDLFADRWIVEGMASATAGYVARTTLDEKELPRMIRSQSTGGGPLNSWTAGFHNSEEREEYAYNASWWVMHKIIEEVGIDAFNDVILFADSNWIAYQASGDPESVAEEDDWKRFLDLAQEVAGSEEAPDLIREYVATTFEKESLDRRDAARVALAGLEESAGDWATPIVIRSPMAAWDFEAATTAIDGAEAVVALGTSLSSRADAAGLEFSDVMEIRYETVTSTFEALTRYGEARIAAIDSIEAAESVLAVEPDLMTQLGLWRNDDPAELAVAARAEYNAEHPAQAVELAEQAVFDLAAARTLGEERARTAAIAAGALLFVLIALLSWILVRRGRRRKAAAAARLQADDAAAAELENAESAMFDIEPVGSAFDM